MIDLDAIGYGNGLIYIGIPRERFYLPQFVDNRDAVLTVLAERGVSCGYHQAEGHRVDRNRDQIVKAFLRHEKKPEWLLMLDSDQEHPTDCGIRLAAWKKPIVGALYFHRGQSHDPFVFDYVGKREDDNKRMTNVWAPKRDLVYDFLEANKVPMRNGGFVIDKPAKNPLIECDAIGTGCILIHRSVLEEIPFPWFEYREGGNSEDLMFCKMAKEDYGIPIYCDISTVCGHYTMVPLGQAQFRMNYLNRGINITAYTKGIAARWYSKAFGITTDEAIAEIEAGNGTMVTPIWRKRFGKTHPEQQQIEEFYTDPEVGKAYVMELLHWNFLPQFNAQRNLLVGLREMNVMEIGAGIGTVALQLWIQRCNVLAVETNQVLRDFIDIRYQEMLDEIVGEIGQLSVVDETWIEKTPAEHLDAIVSFDTFEHMHKETLNKTLKAAYEKLRPGGQLIHASNWEQQDLYPMHYNHAKLFDAQVTTLGFKIENEHVLRKV